MVRTHGVDGTYNHGCRCLLCRAAHARACDQARRRRNKHIDPSQHGLVGTYVNRRCRCDTCRAAWNTYLRERRNRLRLAVNPR